MKFTTKLEGAGQLGAGLRAIARPDELDMVKLKALIEAGEPIRDEAKLEAPFDEGRLFTAVEMETAQPAPRRNPWRIGVAIWVRYTNDYRPLKRQPAGKGKRRGRGMVRDYQKGSIPAVYGAFLNFLSRFGSANNWFGRAWDAEGGQRAVDRVSRSLNRSLVVLFKRRLSGK